MALVIGIKWSMPWSKFTCHVKNIRFKATPLDCWFRHPSNHTNKCEIMFLIRYRIKTSSNAKIVFITMKLYLLLGVHLEKSILYVNFMTFFSDHPNSSAQIRNSLDKMLQMFCSLIRTSKKIFCLIFPRLFVSLLNNSNLDDTIFINSDVSILVRLTFKQYEMYSHLDIFQMCSFFI